MRRRVEIKIGGGGIINFAVENYECGRVVGIGDGLGGILFQ
jgi:hypothetical protein